MSSSFGSVFRVSTWGESHGAGIGVVVDGCPARVALTREMIQRELDLRKPGQSDISTQRKEPDTVEILSGVMDGKTLGTPISMMVRNVDARPAAYDEMAHAYRPSHADYCYDAKYGIRPLSGGGRASARETIGRVAAGAVAKAVVQTLYPKMDVLAWVESVHDLVCTVPPHLVDRAEIQANDARTADRHLGVQMAMEIRRARNEGDSLGGVVACTVRNCPVGLGDPVFDKLEATLAHAMMSIPACKGFEVGSGFRAPSMTGSEHNDIYYYDGKRVRTRSNNSGGIQGGISNGEDINMRLAFKPTATILAAQNTINDSMQEVLLRGRGRHDPCVLPRAVPIVEAMAWIVLCDHILRQRSCRL
ncbi:MAG: chorismate synthase [Akkermansia sp.]|nr:chorismate synthase [Akkermansia sp.]